MKISELKQKVGAFQVYLLALILIGLCLYSGFHLGNVYYEQQEKALAVQEQSITNLKLENNKFIKNLNILGVELEVAKLAQKKAFIELEQGIEREKDLRKKIGFYQQVMAPELTAEGLLIDGFNVQPALSDNSFRFELVLIQQNKVKTSLNGILNISLIGSENGQAKKYSLESLLVNVTQEKLKFGFKYFQLVEGEITLPEGFEPEQVSVQADVYHYKTKKGEVSSTFDWLISES
ncbi:DUF6776 family protein [Paraglaciecola sp. L3A3]|uniref:DUF6776 family protein n=1 Tax=Paraglaciecola sp. L3A3 TaxID=2686358 RepID=UPI0018EF0D8B|nr:DUF6776 family protein [Paraglaciecola sp. L3A3]